jgi:hypothetical protein
MTFCLAVVEKAEEPFMLPFISPGRSMVCRISSFGSVIDDSVSRRGSNRCSTPQMSEKPKLVRPAGPRAISFPNSVASEPAPELSRPEDDLLMSDTEEEYAKSEPALKLPEPTLPLLSERYQPEATEQSADWKHDWSVFACEAGLRASGTSTVADASTFAESSVSDSTTTSAPAPYSVWTPTKPAQPAPAARSYRTRTLTSISSKPSLPTVHEVVTPTVDIFDFMGGYAGPDGADATLRDETRSDSGARILNKPRKLRVPPKVTVEDVPDEAFTSEQRGPRTPPKGPERSKTPSIPGAFVDDYPSW